MTEGIISKANEQRDIAAGKKPQSIRQLIKSMEGEIAKALPSVLTPERFTRITLSALSTNQKLAECTPNSFLAAMMTAAQLGVEPNTPLGQAYLIPYKGQCQFQLGYKGMIDLAYRSGEVKMIQAHTVYENDDFDYELGLEPKLHHVPAKKDRGAPEYFYAVFHTKDGGYGFEVMSLDDIQTHAKKYSKSYNNGPWQTNFEEMAKKTVLKRALKYAPLKSDFVKALSADETIKASISDDMFSEPDVTIVDSETGEVLSEGEATNA
jgi:recombination protein RecT